MIQSEPISGLLLDENNPRFTISVSGQDDAVTALLVEAPAKMINLARDIVEQGILNPTEIPIAVDEDGDLVVIEGNRRLACLKLLANPELALAASPQIGFDAVKRFKDIAKIGPAPTVADVFIADDREAARHWIELRHTGENEGVGVREWAAWQANNFRRKRGSHADRATIFCDAMDSTYPYDEVLLSDVETVRRTKLTTLGRLVADPHVRESFGFAFDTHEIVFHFEPEDLLEGFRRIFEDLAGELTVTEIKTKGHRAAYVSDRESVLPNRGKRLPKPRASGANRSDSGNLNGGRTPNDRRSEEQGTPDTDSNENGEAVGHAKPASNAPRPPKPEQVIFQGLRLRYVYPRCRKLLKGAQKINIADSPQVPAVLVRILLELVVSEGIEKGVVKGSEQERLKRKVRNALLALDPLCENPVKRNKSLEMAWTRTQDDDGIAVQSMNAFVHNIYGDPTAEEVRQLSATFRPVLEGIDALIGGAK